MRLLRITLYLVLSFCLLWASAILVGPKIISWLISGIFSERQLLFTELEISPKLEISAIRAEFNFVKDGHTIHGTVRAPKFKVFPKKRGWIFQLSSGLIELNDEIKVLSPVANFHTASIFELSKGKIFFMTPEIVSGKNLRANKIKVSSDLDLLPLELRNIRFSTEQALSSGAGAYAEVAVNGISGFLEEFLLGRDWQSQILGFELRAEKSEFQSERLKNVSIHSLSLNAQNDASVLKMLLEAESVSVPEKGLYLKRVKADPNIDLATLRFLKETHIQIGEGRFEQTKPNKISVNINALEAILGLHSAQRFLFGSSNFTELKIWNDKIPLITIPKLTLDMSSTMSRDGRYQDLNTQFEANINGEKGSILSGKFTSQFINKESRDCLVAYCPISQLLLDVTYKFEGEKIIGNVSCSLNLCDEDRLLFAIETSNTPVVFEGLAKQNIINPIGLIMFVSSLRQGKEIGSGHKIQF